MTMTKSQPDRIYVKTKQDRGGDRDVAQIECYPSLLQDLGSISSMVKKKEKKQNKTKKLDHGYK